MRLKIFICLLLAGVTLALYWPARHYGVICFDDPLFVTDNGEINAGLTWHSLRWALTSVLVANWHPVTSLSFVLTHQLWGRNPGAEHLVNAGFHAANAALLFLVLHRMTNAVWRSATVAAVFAWHPLRVESVAWIAERKDVLCGFFFLLTLLWWARFVQNSESRIQNSEAGDRTSGFRLPASGNYFGALICFALALMSKPMAVTLPWVLLLLDYWPLQRFKVPGSGFRVQSLVWEKIPFFALAGVFCGLTYEIQKNFAAMTPWATLGLAPRAANAVASYLQYPADLLWPARLAILYPYPKNFDAGETALAALLLLAVSVFCVRQLSRRPWLAVGWFWYLGTMLPVIGLLQVGDAARADRYTYLPLIGPVISLVWLAAEIFRARKIFPAAAAAALAACAALTVRQVGFWRDSLTLFGHSIAVTAENAPAYSTLGIAEEHAGDTNAAIICYRAAIAISPNDPLPRRDLAGLLEQRNYFAAAAEQAGALLALNPDDAAAHLILAEALGSLGRGDKARFHLNEAVRLNPDFAEALNNLAWRLAASPDANVRDGPQRGPTR